MVALNYGLLGGQGRVKGAKGAVSSGHQILGTAMKSNLWRTMKIGNENSDENSDENSS